MRRAIVESKSGLFVGEFAYDSTGAVSWDRSRGTVRNAFQLMLHERGISPVPLGAGLLASCTSCDLNEVYSVKWIDELDASDRDMLEKMAQGVEKLRAEFRAQRAGIVLSPHAGPPGHRGAPMANGKIIA